MPALTPEDFGAAGDRKKDDTAALQAMFDQPSTTHAPLHFQLRKQYKITAPLRIASAPACQFFLDGEGGSIWYAGDRAFPALTIGDATKGNKVFWSRITGLKLWSLGVAADAVPQGEQLLIEDADFTILDNVVVSAPGRVTGIKTLRGNSLDFRSVHASGALVQADIAANVFSWTAGKLQQGPLGLRYSGTQFDIRSLDLSFLTEGAVELNSAACGSLSFYCEKIGPKTPYNTAAMLRGINSNNFVLSGGILNGTWGAQSQPTHCGYGAVLDGCEYVDFVAYRFQRIQLAAIHATAVKAVTVRRSCEWRFPTVGPRVTGPGAEAVIWED